MLTPGDFFRGVIFLAIFPMGRYNSSGLPRKGCFSFRFGRLHPKFFDIASEMKDVISLSVGEPEH